MDSNDVQKDLDEILKLSSERVEEVLENDNKKYDLETESHDKVVPRRSETTMRKVAQNYIEVQGLVDEDDNSVDEAVENSAEMAMLAHRDIRPEEEPDEDIEDDQQEGSTTDNIETQLSSENLETKDNLQTSTENNTESQLSSENLNSAESPNDDNQQTNSAEKNNASQLSAENLLADLTSVPMEKGEEPVKKLRSVISYYDEYDKKIDLESGTDISDHPAKWHTHRAIPSDGLVKTENDSPLNDDKKAETEEKSDKEEVVNLLLIDKEATAHPDNCDKITNEVKGENEDEDKSNYNLDGVNKGFVAFSMLPQKFPSPTLSEAAIMVFGIPPKLNQDTTDTSSAAKIDQETTDTANAPKLNQETTALSNAPQLNQETTDSSNAPQLNQETTDTSNAAKIDQVYDDPTDDPQLNQETTDTANATQLNQETTDSSNAPQVNQETTETSDAAKIDQVNDDPTDDSNSDQEKDDSENDPASEQTEKRAKENEKPDHAYKQCQWDVFCEKPTSTSQRELSIWHDTERPVEADAELDDYLKDSWHGKSHRVPSSYSVRNPVENEESDTDIKSFVDQQLRDSPLGHPYENDRIESKPQQLNLSGKVKKALFGVAPAADHIRSDDSEETLVQTEDYVSPNGQDANTDEPQESASRKSVQIAKNGEKPQVFEYDDKDSSSQYDNKEVVHNFKQCQWDVFCEKPTSTSERELTVRQMDDPQMRQNKMPQANDYYEDQQSIASNQRGNDQEAEHNFRQCQWDIFCEKPTSTSERELTMRQKNNPTFDRRVPQLAVNEMERLRQNDFERSRFEERRAKEDFDRHQWEMQHSRSNQPPPHLMNDERVPASISLMQRMMYENKPQVNPNLMRFPANPKAGYDLHYSPSNGLMHHIPHRRSHESELMMNNVVKETVDGAKRVCQCAVKKNARDSFQRDLPPPMSQRMVQPMPNYPNNRPQERMNMEREPYRQRRYQETYDDYNNMPSARRHEPEEFYEAIGGSSIPQKEGKLRKCQCLFKRMSKALRKNRVDDD